MGTNHLFVPATLHNSKRLFYFRLGEHKVRTYKLVALRNCLCLARTQSIKQYYKSVPHYKNEAAMPHIDTSQMVRILGFTLIFKRERQTSPAFSPEWQGIEEEGIPR